MKKILSKILNIFLPKNWKIEAPQVPHDTYDETFGMYKDDARIFKKTKIK